MLPDVVREALLLARVLVLAPLVPLLMRLPLPVVDRLLRRKRSTRIEDARAAALVERAQRHAHPLVRRGCLTRGVTLFWLLDDVRLCFGLGGPADDFGHCWLERDGAPYLERVDPRERFPALLSLPLT